MSKCILNYHKKSTYLGNWKSIVSQRNEKKRNSQHGITLWYYKTNKIGVNSPSNSIQKNAINCKKVEFRTGMQEMRQNPVSSRVWVMDIFVLHQCIMRKHKLLMSKIYLVYQILLFVYYILLRHPIECHETCFYLNWIDYSTILLYFGFTEIHTCKGYNW